MWQIVRYVGFSVIKTNPPQVPAGSPRHRGGATQAVCGLCRMGRRSLWETNGNGGQMALMSRPARVSAGCTHRAPPPSPVSRRWSSCFSIQGSRRVEGWHVGQCAHVASDFPQHGVRWVPGGHTCKWEQSKRGGPVHAKQSPPGSWLRAPRTGHLGEGDGPQHLVTGSQCWAMGTSVRSF